MIRALGVSDETVRRAREARIAGRGDGTSDGDVDGFGFGGVISRGERELALSRSDAPLLFLLRTVCVGVR